MPSLAGHFPDPLAEIVEAAASTSPEKKVGPYITEAVRQRLEREGFIPNTPRSAVRDLALAAAETAGEEAVIAALTAVKASAAATRAATFTPVAP